MIEIAPGVKRTKPFSNQTRKVPIETEKQIAFEYYVERSPLEEIKATYDMNRKQIQALMRAWDGVRVPVKNIVPSSTPEEPKEHIVIIDNESFEFAMFLLNEWQIKHRLPKDFEFSERFESKIND